MEIITFEDRICSSHNKKVDIEYISILVSQYLYTDHYLTNYKFRYTHILMYIKLTICPTLIGTWERWDGEYFVTFQQKKRKENFVTFPSSKTLFPSLEKENLATNLEDR